MRNLNFDEKPDYNYLRGLFRQLLANSGYENDGQYDWILKKEGQSQALAAMKAKDEKKAPLPKPSAVQRQSSQNFKDNRDNRQGFRANTGAQVLAGPRASQNGLPKNNNPLAQFANAP